jgi:hypothetical protein
MTADSNLMPVVGLRLLEGRVGSTLLMGLLASSPAVVCDRRYPVGEYRYLSYMVRISGWIGTPFDPAEHTGVTELLFGPADRGGPLPWSAESLSVEQLGPRALRALWLACSTGFRDREPRSRWYAEKLACPVDPLVEAEIPVRVIDIVRDPRDVVASVVAFGERSGPWGFGRRPGQSEQEWIGGLVTTFAERLDTFLSPAVPSLLLRYEDFVVDLVATASRLSAWLDVDLDASAAPQAPDQHRTSSSPEDSIGRWHRDLDPAIADRIWEPLSARLEALGYSRAR